MIGLNPVALSIDSDFSRPQESLIHHSNRQVSKLYFQGDLFAKRDLRFQPRFQADDQSVAQRDRPLRAALAKYDGPDLRRRRGHWNRQANDQQQAQSGNNNQASRSACGTCCSNRMKRGALLCQATTAREKSRPLRLSGRRHLSVRSSCRNTGRHSQTRRTDNPVRPLIVSLNHYPRGTRFANRYHASSAHRLLTKNLQKAAAKTW